MERKPARPLRPSDPWSASRIVPNGPTPAPGVAPFRMSAAYQSDPAARTQPTRQAMPRPNQYRASELRAPGRDGSRVTLPRAGLPLRGTARHSGACETSCACCDRMA
jgi:hypothetical protein